MKIIMVVAADLAFEGPDRVIIGPETRIACDRAIELVQEYEGSIAIATAGEAGRRWHNSWMSILMVGYMLRQGLSYAQVETGFAHAFTTDGEMRKLVEKIVRHKWGHAEEIILAVKWWHAPRAWALCKYRLRRAGLGIPVSISWCPSHASFATVAAEFLLAWPKNILRILFRG